MDKRAENTFVAGLNTDRHPLTSQKTELIDAQNIDLIAIGEGYQLILQKREGNLELLLLPPIWNTLYTYLTNEYATYGGVTYKSLHDGNTGVIPVDGIDWQSQPTLLVSAGLRSGYIPLAIKEFNNIAYIISMDPASVPDPITGSLVGELGTFPSPDYTKFIYKTGAALTPGAAVEDMSHWVWDPRINPPDYEFSLTPATGSGEDEAIYSDMALYQLTKAGFTITNTGTLSDTYNLTKTVSPTDGTLMFKDGTLFTAGVDILSLAPGDSAVFTFKHYSPYTPVGSFPYYAPNDVQTIDITVTSISNPINDTKPYQYIYHISSMLQVSYGSGTPETSVFEIGGPPITVSHRIPYAGGYTQIIWTTNDPAITSVTTPQLQYFPIVPGADLNGLLPGEVVYMYSNVVEINAQGNTAPVYRHTQPGFALIPNVGNFVVNVYIEQESN